MTFTNKFFLSLLPALFLVLTAPSLAAASSDEVTREEMNQEISEAIAAIKGYSVEQRDRALEEARAMMDKLDARIARLEDSLQNDWNELSQATREQTNDSLRALRKKRNALSEWYGGLAQSSGEAWEEVKDGFSQAYADLQESWADVKAAYEEKD
jgi:chromosome segregation ATPase